MTLKAPRLGEVLCGLGGLALLVSLWLPWYSTPAGTLTGWEALRTLDVLLAACGALGLFILLVEVTQRAPALTVAFSALTLSVALISSIWAAIRVASPPPAGASLQFALLGLGGAVAVLCGCLVGLRDEGTSFLPGIEKPPSGP